MVSYTSQETAGDVSQIFNQEHGFVVEVSQPLLLCANKQLGTPQGRGKKDAKQVSAAAVLEMLLVNVPESDFLMPGKAKQTKTVQVSWLTPLE